ncbi:MAG TPA: hypothetical protein PKN21_02445, partial [Bacteroidales bacterium]|nr:hypothetical protein [Bacteroidales bacterium]
SADWAWMCPQIYTNEAQICTDAFLQRLPLSSESTMHLVIGHGCVHRFTQMKLKYYRELPGCLASVLSGTSLVRIILLNFPPGRSIIPDSLIHHFVKLIFIVC